jgi:hypothetical protein
MLDMDHCEDTGETFISLHDTDDWAEFWSANGETLADEIGDEDTCFALACNCSLLIGGGAAPEFRVGFVD